MSSLHVSAGTRNLYVGRLDRYARQVQVQVHAIARARLCTPLANPLEIAPAHAVEADALEPTPEPRGRREAPPVLVGFLAFLGGLRVSRGVWGYLFIY